VPVSVTVRGSVWTNVVLGLAIGVVLGLIALPFYGDPFGVPAVAAGTGSLAAMLSGVSQALVNEVLLRLFLVSGAAWLLLRRFDVARGMAAALAVTLATVVQVVLYTPAVLELGFPTTLATVGFLVATVAIPAVAFGVLFWKRGFGTALVADAAAVIALLLLV